MSQTLGKTIRRLSLAVVTVLALYSISSLAATEVRWSQWKTTEVGEKFMTEFKAAFEKDNPDIIYNEVTTIDNALTQPWTVVKDYHRVRNAFWFENICQEHNIHVDIEDEGYVLGADRKLMPTKKGQKPPDLRYFDQPKR